MNKLASFAGGCFWCMQPPYEEIDGVLRVTVGYMGGQVTNPTYKQVCSGQTGHAEAVEIEYEPDKVSYSDLLNVFWKNIDPTSLNRQFADAGTQYRSAIFYHDEAQKEDAIQSKEGIETSGKFDGPIVTEISPASKFYPAEEDHQAYYKKNSAHYNMYKVGSGRAGFIKKTWG